MQIELVPLQDSDRTFHREAHHAAFEGVVRRQFNRWDPEEQDEHADSSLEEMPHQKVLCDGIPCGYVSIIEDEEGIFIGQLVIVPEFQRKGIGTHILKEVLAKAAHSNTRVRLYVHKVNEALKLYRSLGFKIYDDTAQNHFKMEHLPQ